MAAGGTWISNPLTYLPIFAFNYRVGRWFLGGSGDNPFNDLASLQGLMEAGASVTIALMLGSLVMGLLLGPLSYFLGLPLIRKAQERYRKFSKTNPS